MNSYELVRPAGTGSGIWACGECHKPHSIAWQANKPVANINKASADECCRPRNCRYCGKPTELDASGQFQREHAKCIPIFNPPPAHPSMDNPYARLLRQKMSEISEDCWAAGWLVDNEFTLWEILQGERIDYGGFAVGHGDREELRVLSQLANGWIWTGPDGKFTPQLVSFGEWHSIIAKWRAK